MTVYCQSPRCLCLALSPRPRHWLRIPARLTQVLVLFCTFCSPLKSVFSFFRQSDRPRVPHSRLSWDIAGKWWWPRPILESRDPCSHQSGNRLHSWCRCLLCQGLDQENSWRVRSHCLISNYPLETRHSTIIDPHFNGLSWSRIFCSFSPFSLCSWWINYSLRHMVSLHFTGCQSKASSEPHHPIPAQLFNLS